MRIQDTKDIEIGVNCLNMTLNADSSTVYVSNSSTVHVNPCELN